MTTTNHKPATTSDILPADPINPTIHKSNNPSLPTNPSINKSNNPFPLRARCGKVARLPKEIRDQLNQMLLDGIPHVQIIQKLKENFGPRNADIPVGNANPQSNVLPIDPANGDAPSASDVHSDSLPLPVPRGEGRGEGNVEKDGINYSATPESPNTEDKPQNSAQIENPKSKIENLLSLTPHHLTTWKKYGGYRDWLRDQQRIQECKIRHELTLDLARSAEGLASYQAAPKVAVAQICQTIIDLGPEGLKDAMKDSPLNCFRLLNSLARLINSGLKCEHHVIKHAAATRRKSRNGFTSDVVETMENALNMM